MVERIKNIKFDWTVSLSHIITFIGLVASAFAVWNSLDKRVVVLEANDTNNASAHIRIQKDLDEVKTVQREDIKLINAKLDRLIERTYSK